MCCMNNCSIPWYHCGKTAAAGNILAWACTLSAWLHRRTVAMSVPVICRMTVVSNSQFDYLSDLQP